MTPVEPPVRLPGAGHQIDRDWSLVAGFPEKMRQLDMTAQELAELVKAMRDRQKAYFKSRGSAALKECKDLEKQVDDAVAALTNKQADLL